MCYTYYSSIFCLIYYRVVVKINLHQCQCQCQCLDENNDVKHNIFRCLIYSADRDDFGMTYRNFMNALEK